MDKTRTLFVKPTNSVSLNSQQEPEEANVTQNVIHQTEMLDDLRPSDP